MVDTLAEVPEGTGSFTPSPLPEMPFVSPVPLLAPGNVQETAWADQAAAWSRTMHITHGSGSSIFVFADAPADALAGIAPSTVSLRTFAGETIGFLGQGATEGGRFGCTFAVAPGGYFIEVQRSNAPAVCQAVYAISGWQTEVFLPVAAGATAQAMVDLSNCSILMSPAQIGFRPGAKSYLWAESARKTLASGRPNVTPAEVLRGAQTIGVDSETIEDMFEGKFMDPMLGLYGGHLMAMQDSAENRSIVQDVLPNLRKLLGDIPDVGALALYLDDSNASGLQFSEPPMLASSWAMIVKASAKHHDIVPPGSFAAEIAANLWGNGPWLGWKSIDQPPVPPAITVPSDFDWDYLKQMAATELPNQLRAMGLSSSERTVMSYFAADSKRISLAPPEEGASGLQAPPSGESPEAITSGTGLPYSVVSSAVSSLTRKLRPE